MMMTVVEAEYSVQHINIEMRIEHIYLLNEFLSKELSCNTDLDLLSQ